MRYPFKLLHFPKGYYPEKLTQRETISEKELSEHFELSKRIATQVVYKRAFDAKRRGRT